MSPYTELDKQTLQNVIAAFIIDRQVRRLSPRTITYYRLELKHLASFLGNYIFEDISADNLRAYIVKLTETRNRGGVHAAWRPIRAMFLWYEAEYEPDDWKNPARRVAVQPPKKVALPGITPEIFHQLLAVCKTARDKAIISTLYDTGLRAAELLSLDLADIDLLTGTIYIRHGKGDKARIVFAGSVCRRAIRKYLKERSRADSRALFLTDEGDRMTYNGLVNLLRRRSADAGIPRPALHDFRRAFAIQMLRNGCDLARLAALMGHTTLEITRLYLHFLDSDLAAAHAMASPLDKE